MTRQDLVNNIRITLPLIALCLPLSSEHYLKAENACPYETYIRLEEKCIDISKQSLDDITSGLDTPHLTEVNKEIEGVSQELEELREEIAKFCIKEKSANIVQADIVKDMCQY